MARTDARRASDGAERRLVAHRAEPPQEGAATCEACAGGASRTLARALAPQGGRSGLALRRAPRMSRSLFRQQELLAAGAAKRAAAFLWREPRRPSLRRELLRRRCSGGQRRGRSCTGGQGRGGSCGGQQRRPAPRREPRAAGAVAASSAGCSAAPAAAAACISAPAAVAASSGVQRRAAADSALPLQVREPPRLRRELQQRAHCGASS